MDSEFLIPGEKQFWNCRIKLRAMVERVRTKASEQIHEKACSVFPGGVSHNVRYVDPYPIYIESAEGPYIRDVDGNEYIDFWNSHAASLWVTHPTTWSNLWLNRSVTGCTMAR